MRLSLPFVGFDIKELRTIKGGVVKLSIQNV